MPIIIKNQVITEINQWEVNTIWVCQHMLLVTKNFLYSQYISDQKPKLFRQTITEVINMFSGLILNPYHEVDSNLSYSCECDLKRLHYIKFWSKVPVFVSHCSYANKLMHFTLQTNIILSSSTWVTHFYTFIWLVCWLLGVYIGVHFSG